MGTLLMLTALCSCQKAEYIQPFKEFVAVYFDADKTALRDNGAGIFIAAKYNGFPIEWDLLSKKIKVVAGEGKFEFYDTRNGNIVAEKTITVKAGTPAMYTLFQPTLESPVTFIDPHVQESEAGAPQGYIKLKIANYAQDLIPFENVDIKVSISYFDENWDEIVSAIGVIKDVKNTLAQASYHILPDGLPDILPELGYQYNFEFTDGITGQPLLNHGGSYYSNMAFQPLGIDPVPAKNLFTLYLISKKTWGEAPAFIKKGEDFYEISTKILFAN